MKKTTDNKQSKAAAVTTEEEHPADADLPVPEEASEKAGGKPASKTAVKTVRKQKDDGETAGKAAGKTSGKLTGKSTGKSAGKQKNDKEAADQEQLIPDDMLKMLVAAEQMIGEAANAFPQEDGGKTGKEASPAGKKKNKKPSAEAKRSGEIILEGKYLKRIRGYQIEYSLNKDFTDSKKENIRKIKDLHLFVTKLKAGEKYYTRVRVCAKVKKEKYYFDWSEVMILKA